MERAKVMRFVTTSRGARKESRSIVVFCGEWAHIDMMSGGTGVGIITRSHPKINEF